MRISTVLLLCALCLSTTAAYYSIAGLAAIFASAFWPVVAMATILETSKLVVASWLYQKWDIIPGLLKTYLTCAVIVLMFITSLGIFGFLTKAHVEAGLAGANLNLQIAQIQKEIVLHTETVKRYQSQLAQLDQIVEIQLNANRATQAASIRKAQEHERSDIKIKLDTETVSIQNLQKKQVELENQQSVVESKAGPIKYIAEFFSNGNKIDVDQAVRYVIIILVLVFDPLAVLMLIAANISIKHDNKSNKKVMPTDISSNNNNAPIGPHIGQTFCIESTGQNFWWNGTSWEQMNKLDHPLESTGVNLRLDQSIIQQTVFTSMDMWLAKTLSDPVSADSRPSPDGPVPDKPSVTNTVVTDSVITNNIAGNVQIQDPINHDDSNTESNSDSLSTAAKPMIDNHHVLDHFKPTHLHYSSRK